MTKHTFKISNGDLVTSLVLNKDEFATLMTELLALIIPDLHPGDMKKRVDIAKQQGFLSGLRRGPPTEKLFQKYGVETPVFSACVIGFNTAEDSKTGADAKYLLEQTYATLTPELKTDIDTGTQQVIDDLTQRAVADETLRKFSFKHLKGVDRGFKLAFGDQALETLQTTWVLRNLEYPVPVNAEFTEFIRRLLTSIVAVGDACRKGDVEPVQKKDEQKGRKKKK